MSAVQSTLDGFSVCVLPHIAGAFELARGLTANQSDADDIAQEALLRAWKYFDGFQGNSGLPWLQAIVRNTYRSWCARQNSVVCIKSHAPPLLHYSAFECQTIRCLEIRDAVARLPADLRRVIVCREFAGLSCRETAATLGIPLWMVHIRLRRARLELQELLRDYR